MICDTRCILFSVCERVCVCVRLDTLSGCSPLRYVCALSKVEQGMVQAVRLIEEERMSTGRGDRAGGVSSLSPDTSPKLWDRT